MELYIANCSMQDFDFTYMLPENTRPFLKSIGAGKQVVIKGTETEISAIIDQHKIYGLMEVSHVKKGFGGLCYRFNKPISVEQIKAGFSQKEADMIDRAQEARNVTAVAQDEMIRKVAQEAGMKQANVVDFEIKEDKKGLADNGEKFDQTIEIINQDASPSPRRGRPRKA